MEVDRSFIGATMPPFVVEVEKGAIRQFARAIGETNPVYFDEAVARQQGYRSLPAPPTFVASFRPVERQPWLAQLDSGRILAGEQTFSNVRRLVAGDVVSCEMGLADIVEKKGRSGVMQLLVQEVQVTDGDGRLVVVNKRIVIYRAAGNLNSTR
ncbi:MAG: MaoC family dehydratase [Candidimonas sp.]|nr:MAG: MaoC family dehydratase [Candidimonas sp.]